MFTLSGRQKDVNSEFAVNSGIFVCYSFSLKTRDGFVLAADQII